MFGKLILNIHEYNHLVGVYTQGVLKCFSCSSFELNSFFMWLCIHEYTHTHTKTEWLSIHSLVLCLCIHLTFTQGQRLFQLPRTHVTASHKFNALGLSPQYSCRSRSHHSGWPRGTNPVQCVKILTPWNHTSLEEYFSHCYESFRKIFKAPYFKQELCTLGRWDRFFAFETQRTHLQTAGGAPKTSGARLHCFSATESRCSSVFDKRNFTVVPWCLQGMNSLSRAFLIWPWQLGPLEQGVVPLDG